MARLENAGLTITHAGYVYVQTFRNNVSFVIMYSGLECLRGTLHSTQCVPRVGQNRIYIH